MVLARVDVVALGILNDDVAATPMTTSVELAHINLLSCETKQSICRVLSLGIRIKLLQSSSLF